MKHDFRWIKFPLGVQLVVAYATCSCCLFLLHVIAVFTLQGSSPTISKMFENIMVFRLLKLKCYTFKNAFRHSGKSSPVCQCVSFSTLSHSNQKAPKRLVNQQILRLSKEKSKVRSWSQSARGQLKMLNFLSCLNKQTSEWSCHGTSKEKCHFWPLCEPGFLWTSEWYCSSFFFSHWPTPHPPPEPEGSSNHCSHAGHYQME